MSTTTLISLIVVVVAFALFFYLSFKGVNLFLTVFACTLLVSFCTPDGITSIFTAFLPSVGTMFQQFLLLYTIGGAFGFCLMESGLGSAMATHLIKVFGEKWIAVALFVITCLMMAAGVASYQYAILAIALPVLKKLNMSRKVALAAMSAGAGSVAYGTLVGMPNALNIAPTTYLGTTTMAGVGISLVCTAFSVVFIVVYLIMLTNRLKKKGEGFVSYTDDPQNDEDESKLPPAWKGYLCVAAIIGLSLLFQKLGITTHVGTNPDTNAQIQAGTLQAEFSPIGSWIERIRCGGMGLGGVLTKTGLGTVVEEGKQLITANGQQYLLETALRADIAITRARRADPIGNLAYRGSTGRASHPIVATCGDLSIVECDHFCDLGEITPDEVEVPGMFVDMILV